MRIIEDIFPAHSSFAAPGTIDNIETLFANPEQENVYYVGTARVVLTEKLIMVAIDSPEGAKIVFQEEYETFLTTHSNDQTYRLITKSGKMVAFKRDTTCGCGSRLRSWNPYKTLGSSKD
jgi:hypothetical protein